jgi:hypothetical protein
MKTWYRAVCDKCGQAIHIFVENPTCTSIYLGDYDAEIADWLSEHYACNLRLIHDDAQLDELWKQGYERWPDSKIGLLVRGAKPDAANPH